MGDGLEDAKGLKTIKVDILLNSCSSATNEYFRAKLKKGIREIICNDTKMSGSVCRLEDVTGEDDRLYELERKIRELETEIEDDVCDEPLPERKCEECGGYKEDIAEIDRERGLILTKEITYLTKCIECGEIDVRVRKRSW